jgi:hypothetical protein
MESGALITRLYHLLSETIDEEVWLYAEEINVSCFVLECSSINVYRVGLAY